jgi:hypothetical protein
MNLLVPQFLYKTMTGQNKIARQKISRKRGKMIDEKTLHSRRIEVRWKNRNEEKYT